MMNEGSREQPKGSTTAGDRFGGFAMAHLTASILMVSGSPFAFAILDALPEGVWRFVPAFLMGIYFPMGVIAAWMGDWTAPQSTKEKWIAILKPTAVAWLWVGIVLWSVSLDGDNALNVLPMIFFTSIIFAAPSSAFVLFCGSDSFGQLFWTGLLAGILPPALFALGSFWWSRHMGKREGSGRKLLRRGSEDTEASDT